MREVRLFVDAPLQPGLDLPLPQAAAQHALRVLRLRDGDRVILFNGNGQQFRARLSATNPRAANVHVEASDSPVRESPLRVTLMQALARGEKMDWIVQKATELGVARILPTSSQRSEVRLDGKRGAARLDHWRAVAIAACEQCGRNLVPEILAPATLETCLAAQPPSNTESCWALHPGGTTHVRDLAPAVAGVTLAVGPEGGFSDDDMTALRQAGYRELALGPRILRTETAGVAALAALQAVYGDF